ncbi:TetR-like C-terminal domain-containing protein [Streptomyces sp. NPDC017230]|uniref:TetR-like C-terminal domain-containing protein n=1 Tax=unclassified Streptomyces TaxID=2593676 RepID=UPI00379E6EC3
MGAAYLGNALENPDLYRVMFDADFDLEDTGAADETLHRLVQAIERAKAKGRFSDEVDPLELAVQSWTIGHGLASLVATGPLPHQALAHGAPMLAALFTGAGDEPDRCRQSVEHGWGRPAPARSDSRDLRDRT